MLYYFKANCGWGSRWGQ